MEEASIVGVDLAKQVFQVHGAAADGRVLFRKKLSRLQFPKFMAALPPCVVELLAPLGIEEVFGIELHLSRDECPIGRVRPGGDIGKVHADRPRCVVGPNMTYVTIPKLPPHPF